MGDEAGSGGRGAVRELPEELLLGALSTVFESLGRALLCLDRDFRVVHTSLGLDRLAGEGAAEWAAGRPVEEVLGPELFAPGASLRQALASGERREGWGATLRFRGSPPQLVSVTVAAARRAPVRLRDPRVAYFVVLRRAQESGPGTGLPMLFAGMIACSAAMARIFRLIENLGDSEAPVLITGEGGTGKEAVARALHLHSPRREGPFVAVDCADLPGDLLESELFGHARGSLDGAVRERVGGCEGATAGTLFLDRIGALPVDLQLKLLRFLRERTFARLGENRRRCSEARVVAATDADLRRAILAGRFREDLYYRLRVVPVEVPPLRERREDIEPLARYLLVRIGDRRGWTLRLAPDALRALLCHGWPGNVRELENALESAASVCSGGTIHAEDLPGEVSQAAGAGDSPAGPRGDPEGERIRAALDAHRWRRAAAARALGVSRTTLWRKMRQHGLLP